MDGSSGPSSLGPTHLPTRRSLFPLAPNSSHVAQNEALDLFYDGYCQILPICSVLRMPSSAVSRHTKRHNPAHRTTDSCRNATGPDPDRRQLACLLPAFPASTYILVLCLPQLRRLSIQPITLTCHALHATYRNPCATPRDDSLISTAALVEAADKTYTVFASL